MVEAQVYRLDPPVPIIQILERPDGCLRHGIEMPRFLVVGDAVPRAFLRRVRYRWLARGRFHRHRFLPAAYRFPFPSPSVWDEPALLVDERGFYGDEVAPPPLGRTLIPLLYP